MEVRLYHPTHFDSENDYHASVNVNAVPFGIELEPAVELS